MQRGTFHILLLLKRLFILLLVYGVCRILFFLVNHSLFTVQSDELLFIILHGFRFDISSIVYCNALFILLHFIPFSIRDSKGYQHLLKGLFYLSNIPGILLNCIDFIYFRFTLKRTTSDIFRWTGLGEDLKKLLPRFITDFWYVIPLFIFLVVLLEYLYRKTWRYNMPAKEERKVKPNLILQIALTLALAGLCVLGARGGWQLRPITILSASEGISPQNVPLVLNTPFTIITTYKKSGLVELQYFPLEQAEKMFSVVHPKDSFPFSKKNVVVIIMESFAAEYVGGLNNGKGYTPFLDSLMEVSDHFSNAFANGRKSIEGVPAIIAGLPTLMENPYISSVYSGNQFNSLASLLKKQGYNTSFFHGGTNGTMGFDNFSRMAGFESYFGRKEFNNDAHYDGFWGIYDESFMQYFSSQLSTFKQPFVSCFFSLSSHHPFLIPEKYKRQFRKGTLEIHQSIQYADWALRQFFKSAEKERWYNNTLFVITADHTSLTDQKQYYSAIGGCRIPLVFFEPGSSSKEKSDVVVQQIDIMPSVLHRLHYPEAYAAFGRNAFSKEQTHYAISYLNNIYQYIEKDYMMQYNGEKSISLYQYPVDTLLQRNLITKETAKAADIELRLKALIQVYNYRMIHNKLMEIR